MPSSKMQLLYESCISASLNAYFRPAFKQSRISAPKSGNKRALITDHWELELRDEFMVFDGLHTLRIY